MTRDAGDRCRLPQAFWRAADRMGLPAPALLRQARLPATLHIAPETWLSTAQYFALWRADRARCLPPSRRAGAGVSRNRLTGRRAAFASTS